MPEELAVLHAAVCEHRENGPWRQLIDWLTQNPELIPDVFYKALVAELEAVAEVTT